MFSKGRSIPSERFIARRIMVDPGFADILYKDGAAGFQQLIGRSTKYMEEAPKLELADLFTFTAYLTDLYTNASREDSTEVRRDLTPVIDIVCQLVHYSFAFGYGFAAQVYEMADILQKKMDEMPELREGLLGTFTDQDETGVKQHNQMQH